MEIVIVENGRFSWIVIAFSFQGYSALSLTN